jgi:hypothetical protein
MVAPHFGFTDITGIDFAEELCEQANANMKRKRKRISKYQWRVINENVENYDIGSRDSVFSCSTLLQRLY